MDITILAAYAYVYCGAGGMARYRVVLAELNVGMTFLARAFIPLCAGYLISHFFRSVNAVLADPLTNDFGVSSQTLGLLTSVYFFTFALMQVPVGVLLDRYGPRLVQGCLLILASIGAALFATSDRVEMFILARALVGAGVAGCLTAAFTGFIHWFSPNYHVLLNGVFMMLGAGGSVLAAKPASWLLAQYGWSALFYVVAAFTLLAAISTFLFTPETPRSASPTGARRSIRGIWYILTTVAFWRVAPVAAITLGSAFALLGLWAGPWLSDVARLPHGDVAKVLTVAGLGVMLGSGVSGLIDMCGRRLGFSRRGVFAAVALLYGALLSIITLGVTAFHLLTWFSIGFLTNILAIAYIVLVEEYGREYAGRVNAALNLLVTCVAFILQLAIGWIIEVTLMLSMVEHRDQAYTAALAPILVLYVVALGWYVISVVLQRAPVALVGAEEDGK